MTAVPARVRWAVQLIDSRPDARLLEIGCGPGVAAGLLCERLTTGSLLAVDRSAVAVRRATTRNAGHIAAGRLQVRQAALETLDVRPEFDVAFTIDVNVFWTRPDGPALGILAGALRPGGRLLLLYGTGPSTAGPGSPPESRPRGGPLPPPGNGPLRAGGGPLPPGSGPDAGVRVTGPIAAAMTAAGLIDVRVLADPAGVGVTGRRPACSA